MIYLHNGILVEDPGVFEHSEQHQGPVVNSWTSSQSFKQTKDDIITMNEIQDLKIMFQNSQNASDF